MLKNNVLLEILLEIDNKKMLSFDGSVNYQEIKDILINMSLKITEQVIIGEDNPFQQMIVPMEKDKDLIFTFHNYNLSFMEILF